MHRSLIGWRGHNHSTDCKESRWRIGRAVPVATLADPRRYSWIPLANASITFVDWSLVASKVTSASRTYKSQEIFGLKNDKRRKIPSVMDSPTTPLEQSRFCDVNNNQELKADVAEKPCESPEGMAVPQTCRNSTIGQDSS